MYNYIDKLSKFNSTIDIDTNSPYLTDDATNIKYYILQMKDFIKYCKSEHIKQKYNYYKVYSGFSGLYGLIMKYINIY